MTQTLLTTLADFDTQIAAAVSVADEVATLVTATDDDGVALPAGTYGFTIDAGTSSKEYFTAVLSSTALSSIKSISRQGAQTTGFARAHRRGAKVTITDWATLSRMLNLLNGTTGFDSGTPLKYDGNPTLTDDAEIATKKYVDDIAIAGAADATIAVKGIGTVSVAPVSPTAPIFVGDNDPRVPTQDEKDALAGTGTPSSGNPYVTEDSLSSVVPPGVVVPYAGASAPTDWLLCDGSAVSRATYATLFGIISTTYGVGDGSTTFNLPDLQGNVAVGKDSGTFSALGDTGGAETHTLSESEMPAHTHGENNDTQAAYSGGNTGQKGITPSSNTGAGGRINTDSTGGDGAHNNLQPYIVLNYIIKT